MSFEADPGQSANTGREYVVGNMFTSGPLSMKAVENTKVETQKLVNAAKFDGFKISEDGVKPLRDALLEMANKLDVVKRQSLSLSQPPKLGDHPYGHAVAAHDQKGGANEAGSATVVLEQLAQVIKQADEALARAAGIYREGENQVVGALKNFQD